MIPGTGSAEIRKDMKMNKTRLWIFTIIIALILVFIWGNSLLNAETSKALSDYLRTNILGFLFDEMNANQASFLVRKLAHFTEYAVYGIELSLLIVSNWMKWKTGKIFKRILICLNMILITAFIDETIQFFSGRGPAVLDIWIDLAGGALTTCLVAIGTSANKRKRT